MRQRALIIGGDQVMVACDAPQAQSLAMQVVDKCGCVNFFGGLPRGSDPVEIDTNAIHYRHIRVVGTHGSSPHQNDTALSLIADDCIAVSDLITGRIGLDPGVPPAHSQADRLAGYR